MTVIVALTVELLRLRPREESSFALGGAHALDDDAVPVRVCGRCSVERRQRRVARRCRVRCDLHCLQISSVL